MTSTTLAWSIAAIAALGAVACFEGESPIVAAEEGGAGSGAAQGAGATGGSSSVDSSNYSVAMIRAVTDDDPLCLFEPLAIDQAGKATCSVYGIPPLDDPSAAAAACDCEAVGRTPVSAERRATVVEHLKLYGQCSEGRTDDMPDCSELCVCEVPQAEGSDWSACERDPSPSDTAPGWCYVSPEQGVGDPALVDVCPDSLRSRIRLLPDTRLSPNELFLLGCHSATALPGHGESANAALGDLCIPADEYLHTFSSYSESEVTIVSGTGACASGICLVNHFRGRVSCPYGQTEEQAATDPQCFLPGSNVAVTVPVEAQLLDRRADIAAVCSCRCDGPGDGPFCTCGEGMECKRLVEPIGLPGDEHLAGSYCIPAGTAYDATRPPVGHDVCSMDAMDCGEPHPY